MPWFKGNLHCHSSNSDGQLSPSSVAQYYKSIEHDFLGIADHNSYTAIETWGDAGKILAIPCCEYTGDEFCHVVAVGVKEPVAPNLNEEDIWKRCTAEEKLIIEAQDNHFKKKVLILQDGINKTLAAGGIPIIAHPFWHWTYNFQEVLELKNCTHFEVCNASPDCNSIPSFGKSFPDEMWDNLLSHNYRIFGSANDDAHVYSGSFTTRAPFGGRGWNVIKAPKLTQESILDNFRNGHFYATTGIEINDYKVSTEGIFISVNLQNDERVNIDFIGKNGKILKSTHSPLTEYKFTGNETYVRVRIASTCGVWAWFQPIFMDTLEQTIKWTQL